MAKEFSVKDFLQKNKVGPYGLIKENYTDLRPVGAGNLFGGYTQALREDLEEDDTYLGPKKPEPHQIYAQDDEYGDEDNAWMEDVHNEIVGDWQVDYDDSPGVLIWTCYNDSSFYAVATPKWDNQPGTPIEIVKVEEDGYIGDDVHMLYTEKQDEFVSFEEYAETIEPILEKYLQAKKRGEVDEDINNGPVGNDKLEEGKKQLAFVIPCPDAYDIEEEAEHFQYLLDKAGVKAKAKANMVGEEVEVYTKDEKKARKVIEKNGYQIGWNDEIEDNGQGESTQSDDQEQSHYLDIPTGPDKGWNDDELDEDDDEDFIDDDKLDRFYEMGGRQLTKAADALLDDGFSKREIINYLQNYM